MYRGEMKATRMKKGKGLQALLCALLIVFALLAVVPSAFAAERDPFVETRQVVPFSNPIANGQFAGAAGAEWTVYDDGTVVVGSGTINWATSPSPWDAHSAIITNIVFEGPNTAINLANPNNSSLRWLFFGLTSLERIEGLENIDVSAVTNTQAMFQNTPNLTYVSDLSGWDTSNVRDTRNMFMNTGLSTIDVANWDMSSAVEMRYMFRNSAHLTSLDLSAWNVSQAQVMRGMFENTPLLTSVGDLSHWDPSSVTNMSNMFQDTPMLTSIPGISHWNTGSATNMTNMFFRAGVTSLDLSAWDTSSVTAMGFMFADSALTSLDVSTWDTSNVTAMNTMFRNTALSRLDLSNWDTSSANMGSMFQGMTALRVLTLGGNWIVASGNPALPAITEGHPYTNRWQNVAGGTEARPAGSLSYTSSQLMTGTNGTSNTWVWERIAIEVRFVAGANGTLEGGTPDVVITVPYGTILTAADIPAPIPNTGWVFSEWQPSNPLGHTVTADITFTAEFIADGGGTTPPPPPPPPLPYRYAYLIGYDGLIRPNANITRAEVATIFFRVITEDMRREYWSQTNPYSDVAAGSWFNTAVSTTTELGIFQGRPDGTFAPNLPITRAELAAVITRFMDVMDMANIESDFFNDIAGHWANGYINVAAINNWVRGPQGLGGPFHPDQAITRAETAAMVNRIFERLPETTADLLPDMVTWPDNANTDAWYYLYIQAASNSYTFTRRGSFENWVTILPVPDWVAIERASAPPTG